MIYLDNNATTALDPVVADAMLQVLGSGPLNPSSQHRLGQQSRCRLDDSVERIGKCLGTRLNDPGCPRLILTSGGTEANNLALRGLRGGNGPLIVSQIEHPSVLAVAQADRQRGRPVRYLGVDSDGVVLTDVLAKWLESADESTTVSIMSANNETGVVQPIECISRLCRTANVALHIDATQSITKQPFILDSLGATAVSISPHKFHGPVGVGGLWLSAGETIVPQLEGGRQQLGSRPGTEPLALIVAMCVALERGIALLPEASLRLLALRDRFENSLLSLFPELVIHGHTAPRLPNTSCISFIGADRQSLLMALDMAGVACSSGSACTSGSSPPSHVLRAMHASEAEVASMIRFGVSRFTEDQDIDASIDIISRCYKRLRR